MRHPFKIIAAGGIFAAALAVSGCGLPEPPNLRTEMAKSLSNVGVRPIYPLRETPRIGQIYIVDASTDLPTAQPKAYEPTNILLTDELVPEFEKRLRRSAQMTNRFSSQSSPHLTTQGNSADEGQALALAAFPSYTLVSIDDAVVSGYLPQGLATFLASIGLHQTRVLHLNAEKVEVADLPLGDVLDIIHSDCRDQNSQMGNQAKRQQLSIAGTSLMRDYYEERKKAAMRDGNTIPDMDLKFYLLYRVYYLRSIAYSFDEKDVSAAVLQAAITNQFPQGVAPPTMTNVAQNTKPPPAAGTPTSEQAATKAEVEELQAEIDAIRQAVGSNTQVATHVLRATARGIELVEVFDRPLAFGHEGIAFGHEGIAFGHEGPGWDYRDELSNICNANLPDN